MREMQEGAYEKRGEKYLLMHSLQRALNKVDTGRRP